MFLTNWEVPINQILSVALFPGHLAFFQQASHFKFLNPHERTNQPCPTIIDTQHSNHIQYSNHRYSIYQAIPNVILTRPPNRNSVLPQPVFSSACRLLGRSGRCGRGCHPPGRHVASRRLSTYPSYDAYDIKIMFLVPICTCHLCSRYNLDII